MKIILNKAQYDYLKNNNILEQYKKNVKNATIVFDFEDYDFSKGSSFIRRSFHWSDTKEGFCFWKGHDLISCGLESNEIEIIEV